MFEVMVLLVVEDEPLILMAIQDALEASGYVVLPTTSGAEAITVLDNRHREIAGIITDVRLGSGPNGWQVSRRARELRPDIPVVYATGDSAPDWPAFGVPQSILVPKPYVPEQMLDAISAVMVSAVGRPRPLSGTSPK
ncbi:response regulator [Novosphingobium sp. G106]|nr:response regulator [Novosphingobium sp. G106]MBV1692154.1 response regulator [Novosphingobium sp. G106]